MNYRESLPEMAPLAQVRIAPAPAVQAGTPLNENDIYEAIREEKHRYRMHKSDPVVVTGGDTVRATLRTGAIVLQHLAAMHPDVNAPQWAVDLQQQVHDQLQQQRQHLQDQLQQQEQHMGQHLQDELQQQRQHLQDQLQQQEQHMGQHLQDQLQQQGQDFQNQLQVIGEELQRTNAILHNTQAAAFNARVVADGALSRRPHHFRRFVKATEGLGNALPRAPAPVVAIPVLQVGEVVPRRFFPRSYAALQRWSHQQISNLSILLNDDFGIDRTDDLSERRMKLQYFLAN